MNKERKKTTFVAVLLHLLLMTLFAMPTDVMANSYSPYYNVQEGDEDVVVNGVVVDKLGEE